MVSLRSTLTAAAAAAMLGLLPSAALASPAVSAWSHSVNLDTDGCIDQARRVMAGGGWTNIQRGQGDLLMADKGPLSGVVACLPDDVSTDEATLVVVISGGGAGEADAESDRLHDVLAGR